jgi:hypothetical protein
MKAFLAVAFLVLITQPSGAADCSRIVDMLARLRCFDRAADARLPRPKGAKVVEQEDRVARLRKSGARPTKDSGN